LILQARNNLFDEELYHEMHREARNLNNRGIKCTNDAISLPIQADVSLIFDLVSTAQSTEPDLSESDASQTERSMPLLVATAVKILLSHAHRENYNRRSRPPPPLTERPPPRLLYHILRPILSYFQHRSALEGAQQFFGSLSGVLGLAGIFVGVEKPEHSFNILTFLETKLRTTAPFVERLVKSMIDPLESSVSINLPAAPATFVIRIRTHTMGTEYKIETEAPATSLLAPIPQGLRFTDPRDLEDHALHLFTLGIISIIESNEGKRKWSATSLHGEINVGSGDELQVVSISLEKQRLELKWSGVREGEASEDVITWTSIEGETSERAGLLHTLESFKLGSGKAAS